MPQIIDATQARNSFSEILNRVVYGREEFVIRRQGQPIAQITRFKDHPEKETQRTDGIGFLKKLSGYGLKDAPTDLAENHDKYTWE